MTYKFYVVFLLLLSIQNVTAIQNGRFATDLVSGLSPLLTLFGDQFARQFLSEAFTWFDHIVFAMAPLGITTALVSAVRIGGSDRLRGLVGRARENLAQAEVELMSSTSEDVCELYNGRAVVRTLGRPVIKQLIYLDWLYNEETFGLFTLEDSGGYLSRKKEHNFWFTSIKNACSLKKNVSTDSRYEKMGSTHDPELAVDCRRTSSQSLFPNKAASISKAEQAPNILLNLHGGSNTVEMALCALIGIILQAAVVVFAGLIAHHSYWKPKFPAANPTLGFPFLASGTVILCISMILCSFIIEQSTEEERWQVNCKPNREDEPRSIRVFWLQKSHKMGVQNFDSFLLTPKEERRELLTSRRSSAVNTIIDIETDDILSISPTESTNKCESYRVFDTLTLLAVASGSTGFVAQFQGLRLSHWSCAIAQFVAMCLMTFLRAVVRRGLTQRPAVKRLPEEYELDRLALCIALGRQFFGNLADNLYLYWEITTPTMRTKNFALQAGDRLRDKSENPAQRAMEIRKRLGQLTKWTGPLTQDAVAVAKAIEVVMAELETSKIYSFTWGLKVKVSLDKNEVEEQEIRFVVKKDHTAWKTDVADIDAALSLWNYQLKSKSSGWLRAGETEMSRLYCRVLGDSTETLRNDLSWWVGMGVAQELDCSPKSAEMGSGEWLGFHGLGNNAPSTSKILTVNAPCRRSLAHHFFTAFMWALAESITDKDLVSSKYDNALSFDVDNYKTWNSPTLKNAKISHIVREIQHLGLGPSEQIYLSMIPPLSYAGKLPDIAIIDLIQQQVLGHIKGLRWALASAAYSSLLEMSISRAKEIRIDDKFVFMAVAVTIEFLLETYEVFAFYPFQSRPATDEVRTGLKNKLKQSPLNEVVASLRKIYSRQHRVEKFEKLGIIDYDYSPDTDEVSRATEHFDYNYENSTDALGWRQVEYQVLDSSLTPEHCKDNHADISGKSIVHYAAEQGKGQLLFKLFSVGAKCDTKGRDGRLPIHRAAAVGEYNSIQWLIRGGSPVDSDDGAERTPLILAAAAGHKAAVKRLLDEGQSVNVNSKDAYSRSALLYAAPSGYTEVVKLLLAVKGIDVNATTNDGDGPLALAVLEGKEDVVKLLLDMPAVNINSTDSKGRTPLVRSKEHGHDVITRLLLDAGAVDDAID